MNLASACGPLLQLVLIQVCGLLAGHSQGPCLRRVVDQLVWLALLQGYYVNLAPTHPPGQVTQLVPLHLLVHSASSPRVPTDPLRPISILVPMDLHVPQSLPEALAHHHQGHAFVLESLGGHLGYDKAGFASAIAAIQIPEANRGQSDC